MKFCDYADSPSSICAVQLGGLAAEILPEDFMMPGMTNHAVYILRLLSAMIGLWLWGLAVWYVVRRISLLHSNAETRSHIGSSSYLSDHSGSMLGLNTRPRLGFK